MDCCACWEDLKNSGGSKTRFMGIAHARICRLSSEKTKYVSRDACGLMRVRRHHLPGFNTSHRSGTAFGEEGHSSTIGARRVDATHHGLSAVVGENFDHRFVYEDPQRQWLATLQFEGTPFNRLWAIGQSGLGGVDLQLFIEHVVINQRLLLAARRGADSDAVLFRVGGAHLNV